MKPMLSVLIGILISTCFLSTSAVGKVHSESDFLYHQAFLDCKISVTPTLSENYQVLIFVDSSADSILPHAAWIVDYTTLGSESLRPQQSMAALPRYYGSFKLDFDSGIIHIQFEEEKSKTLRSFEIEVKRPTFSYPAYLRTKSADRPKERTDIFGCTSPQIEEN